MAIKYAEKLVIFIKMNRVEVLNPKDPRQWPLSPDERPEDVVTQLSLRQASPDQSSLEELGEPVSDSPGPLPEHPPDRPGQTAKSLAALPMPVPVAKTRWGRKARSSNDVPADVVAQLIADVQADRKDFVFAVLGNLKVNQHQKLMTAARGADAIDQAMEHKLDCSRAMARIPRAIISMVTKQYDLTSQSKDAPGVCFECSRPISAKTWLSSGNEVMPELFVSTEDAEPIQKDKAHLRLCARCLPSSNGPIFA